MKLLGVYLILVLCAVAFGRHHQKDEALPLPEKDLHFRAEEVDSAEDTEKPGRRPHFVGTNFAVHRDIPHGEREIRVFYDGVIAMETVIRSSGEMSLFYREVTDGKNLIQLIYRKADVIADCDVSRDRADVKSFIAKFLHKDVRDIEYKGKHHSIDIGSIIGNDQLFAGQNASYQLLENRALLQPYSTLVDIDTLKSDCISLHRLLRQIKRERELRTTPDSPNSGPRDHAARGTDIHSRAKRSMLVVPGTNWCGSGDNANTFQDLGEDAVADRCCREHDFCPHYIEGFDTKYNLFNYRFSTVSHCYCDESFRTCLKSAGTEASQMVGDIYFVIIGMKCFEFHPQKVCVERSWWGRCLQYERQMQAEIMGTLSWD